MYFFFGFSIDSNILKFMKGVKQMRTYLIDTVWKSAPAIFSIGSVTDHNSYSTHYDRSTIPAFVDLLKSPKKPQEEYPTYPWVLFTNYEVVNEELFGSSAILNVCLFHPLGFNYYS
jgi:hypothetical protein